jgi:hypothetical protein
MAGATLTADQALQEPTMSTLRTITIAAVLACAFSAGAQIPSSTPAAPAASAERMSAMDAHMKSMREMHDKMSRARTPEERQALMTEHMRLMQQSMAMMGGMQGMGPADMSGRMQMMEKHMEMMHSMMQMMMMMDQMAPPAKR